MIIGDNNMYATLFISAGMWHYEVFANGDDINPVFKSDFRLGTNLFCAKRNAWAKIDEINAKEVEHVDG